MDIKNTMLDYNSLRNRIHEIFFDFYDREIECYKSNEFDFEWMEFKTDNILSLIKQQGGKISLCEKENPLNNVKPKQIPTMKR